MTHVSQGTYVARTLRYSRHLLELAGLTARRCAACLAPFCPPACTGPSLAHLVCPSCAHSLQPHTLQTCPLCGLPASVPLPSPVPCGACLTTPPPWQALTSYGLYQESLKEQLLHFKYGENLTLIPLLGHMLATASTPLLPVDLMVPMPRHESRLRERGFNQVHELARVAARAHALPLRPDALLRTRPTLPQAQLTAKERQQNPQGSFAAVNVQGMRVLLVDDIMTTGSTLRHAAMALNKAGAASIRVVVVARAVLQS